MAMNPTDTALPLRDFPGLAELQDLVIPPSASSQPAVDALKDGRLTLQCCANCHRHRLPVAPVCPYCGSSAFDWKASTGQGVVVSWVRYPRSYLPAFEALIPYVVLCVELTEGPRLFGRLVGKDVEPRIGMPVSAVIERWTDGGHAVAFAATDGAA